MVPVDDTLPPTPTPLLLRSIASLVDRVRTALDRYEDSGVEFAASLEEGEALHAFKARVETAWKQADDLIAEAERVSAYLAEMQEEKELNHVEKLGRRKAEGRGGGGGEQGQESGGGAPLRPALDLIKPQVLKHTASPSEFTDWRELFRSFYISCKVASCDLRTQHNMLKSSLDVDLRARITGHNMPIFSDEELEGPDEEEEEGENWRFKLDDPDLTTCMGTLQSYFATAHPLTIRRLNCFKHRQPRGSSFADFMREIDKRAAHTNLRNASYDEYIVAIYLQGCTDPLLVTELLKIQNPTPEKYRQCNAQYEWSQTTVLGLHSPAQIAALSARQLGGRQRGGDSRNKTVAPTSLTREQKQEEMATKKECFRCARPYAEGHQSTCRAKLLTCSKCQKVGHIQKQCLFGLPSSQPRLPPRSSPNRDRRGQEGHRQVNARAAEAEQDPPHESPPTNLPAIEYDHPPYNTSSHTYAQCLTASGAKLTLPSDTDPMAGAATGICPTVAATGMATGTARTALRGIPGTTTIPPLHVRVYEYGRSKFFDCMALADSGANRSIISSSLLEEKGFKWNRSSTESVRGFSGEKCKMLGTVLLEVKYSSFRVKMDLLVAEYVPSGLLLSWNDMARLRLIRRHYTDMGPDPNFPDPATDAFAAAPPCLLNGLDSRGLHAYAAGADTIESLITEFADVFDDSTVTAMKGEPAKVILN